MNKKIPNSYSQPSYQPSKTRLGSHTVIEIFTYLVKLHEREKHELIRSNRCIWTGFSPENVLKPLEKKAKISKSAKYQKNSEIVNIIVLKESATEKDILAPWR